MAITLQSCSRYGLTFPNPGKFAKPYFKMFWHENIPVCKIKDRNNKLVEISVIAGEISGIKALPPAPDSWAADPENQVAIWTIKMGPGAEWTLPAASSQAKRCLYFYEGDSLNIDGNTIASQHSFEVPADMELTIMSGNTGSSLLLLQGIPINEPVVQYGPFVMNTEGEIRQAIYDYNETEFGGWPWPRPDQVHPRTKGRFAKYRDGTEETPYL